MEITEGKIDELPASLILPEKESYEDIVNT